MLSGIQDSGGLGVLRPVRPPAEGHGLTVTRRPGSTTSGEKAEGVYSVASASYPALQYTVDLSAGQSRRVVVRRALSDDSRDRARLFGFCHPACSDTRH